MGVRQRGKRFQGMVRRIGFEPVYETFDTRKEAKEWVQETERKLDASKVTNPDVKLGTLMDQYVLEIAPKRRLSPSHLAHDIPSIRRCFAEMSMRDLAGKGLTTWLLKKATSPSHNEWLVSTLFGFLRQVDAHWDVVVPWDDLRHAKKKMASLGYLSPSEERSRRVSDDELFRIKAAFPKGTHRVVFTLLDFSLVSAMRISEVCRIQWSDFNEKDRTIVIRDRKHPRKKMGNHQTVPLINGAFEVLMRHRKERDEVRRRAKHKRPNYDTDIIFNRNPQGMSNIFHQATVAAGVQDMVLHDLRHEGITRLFEAGFQIQEVALVSGHTDWKNLRRYTNLRAADLVLKEQAMKLAA